MTTFADASALHPSPHGPVTAFTDDWLQGRTAFGGLQAAAALRAARVLVPDRPLRSVSVTFVGPSGVAPLRAEAAILRSGASVTIARSDLLGAEGVVASLTGAFGDARSSVVAASPRLDDLPPLNVAPSMPYLEGITPRFTQHVEIQITDGSYPFMGSQHLHHAGWCRHKTDPGPAEGALLGLLDAWPSPALQAFRGPAPASTVTWSAQLVSTPATISTDDWFFLTGRVLGAAGDGFATMRAELYAADGRMVAHLEQLVALYDRR